MFVIFQGGPDPLYLSGSAYDIKGYNRNKTGILDVMTLNRVYDDLRAIKMYMHFLTLVSTLSSSLKYGHFRVNTIEAHIFHINGLMPTYFIFYKAFISKAVFSFLLNFFYHIQNMNNNTYCACACACVF